MKYTLQVFTGFRDRSDYRAEDIIGRIRAAASGMEIDQVIIGWSRETSVYRELGSFLHKEGIRMLLWLPVFTESAENPRPDRAKDVFGRTVSVPDSPEDESFRFVCPSSALNARTVTDTYEKYFSDCGFDGVFLDRVRNRSFAAGVSGVLSCACERCGRAFRRMGVSIGEVRNLYELRKDAFFDISSWPMNGEFVPENQTARNFFEAREEILAGAVSRITGYFKAKGLIVGLDLFAPFISRLAGQSYALIARNADFIKPMLYRRTEAPAGIGYEYALLKKYAPNARGIIPLSMDRAFLRTQLQAVRSVSCEKYPGIEINCDRELVKTDPEYIRESLAEIRDSGFDHAVLCWDVMRAPEAHFAAAALP